MMLLPALSFSSHGEHARPAPVCRSEAGQVLLLLLPIKRASDVIYGARYAKRLLEWGIQVKVHLLHVTGAGRQPGAPLVQERGEEDDAQAEEVMREAALYLSRSRIDHCSFLRSGDIVFSILDAAEMLDCREIVLPAPGAWRLFSGDLTRRIARSSRSATVVLAGQDGMRCPAHAS
ncbi:nucleotide-binding universal stress UspA family protein [Oxalobacteraceae bacterium GrIS 1.11]